MTGYFTGIAELYEQHRPSYPQAAIDDALDGLPHRPHVADVGCGTGIASRLFAARSAAVIGIEPNADMVEQARAGADIAARPTFQRPHRSATSWRRSCYRSSTVTLRAAW